MNMLDPKLRETAPLTFNESSYYRSKIFHAELGVNPLLQIAAPLFSLTKYLKDAEEPEDVSLLLQNFIHEVKAFEDKVRCYDYSSTTISDAHYMLCAFIDELILCNSWAFKNKWQQDNLLNYFYKGEVADNRFFLITEQALHDPKNNLDLLELIYLILSLGFKGKYQKSDGENASLGQLQITIYDLIRSQRGEFSRDLLVQASPKDVLYKTASKKRAKRFSMRWVVVGFVLLVLGGFYISLNLHINHVLQLNKLSLMH